MHRVPRLEVRLDTSLESLLAFAAKDVRPSVLATLVATAGSTYRKPGARMLILNGGGYHGLLSGGCLESDLGAQGQAVLDSGVARVIEYDMRGPDDILFGIGAGCEGAMRILLEPAGPDSPAAGALAIAGRATAAGRPCALIAVHQAHELALGTYEPAADLPQELTRAMHDALRDRASREVTWEGGGRTTRAFVQFLAPPPHVLICGAGPDAQPVVGAALALGWRVTVVDHRPAYALAERFPGATVRCCLARELAAHVTLESCHAAVVMSHHLAADVIYLRVLAAAGSPGYVGLLGPAARRQRIARELGAAAEQLGSRLRGPVGIDIGAVTPEGIALAIVSEIHAVLAEHSADRVSLRRSLFSNN